MRKKILSMVLIVVMIISITPSLIINAMTAQDGADWALAQVGKSIDVDGKYGAQCVDLVKKYCSTHWGWTPTCIYTGYAKDYASIPLPNSSWIRIKNTPEFIPQPGDIAIWTNGTSGHVAIIISANINSFVSVDQNWYNANSKTGSPAAKVTHNYSGFWGVIRPPFSTENAEENQPIHSSTSATVRDGFFTLKNVSSGKYMNVNGGKDANKTPVDMWTYDGTTDQQFNIVHKGNGKYKLYAACSSSGSNRVVDVYRNGAAPVAGQVVDLWTPDDDTAQFFYIVPLDDGSYVFELAAKDGYVIAPTSASAANTNGSQLTLQKYTGASYQKWKFCNNNGEETYPVGSYSVDKYTVNTGGANLTMRSGAGTTYSKVASVPDGAVLNVTQVSSNWGYTTYGGYSGWVCLDYTMYNPEVVSISIQNKPHNLTYYVGDELDTTDMVINVIYSNNSTRTIIEGFTTDYDFSTAGIKTVTVEYEGLTTSFEVVVIEPGAATINVEAQSLEGSNEVTFDVLLTEATNIYDGNFNVVYDDSVLKYKSYTAGDVLSGCSVIVNGEYASDAVRVTFAGTDELETGCMISFVFDVISKENCETEVELQDVNLYTQSGQAITAEITNSSGNVEIEPEAGTYKVLSLLGDVKNGSFYAEVEIEKMLERDSKDMIIIAVYEDDIMVDMVYMKANVEVGKTVSFGGMLEGGEDVVLKAFVWDDMMSMNALSNTVEK